MTRRVLKLKHIDPSTCGAIHPDGSGKGWIAWSPGFNITAEMTKEQYPGLAGFLCPHGSVGDGLWVRETFCWPEFLGPEDRDYIYKASENGQNWADNDPEWTWTPSIFMPKAACRIFLEITDIRVERLQDITPDDCRAEGIERWTEERMVSRPTHYKLYLSEKGDDSLYSSQAYDSFESLWKMINGRDSWDSNCWVWAISFKRIDKPEGFV